MNRAPDAELYVSSGQVIQNVAGIRQRSGELIQLRHHEGVARSTGGERQPKTWPVPVRAGQAVVDVDAIVPDLERVQPLALGTSISAFRPCSARELRSCRNLGSGSVRGCARSGIVTADETLGGGTERVVDLSFVPARRQFRTFTL